MPGPRAGFARFIGISLGGERGKSTALARLELGPDGPEPRLLVAEATLRRGHRGSGAVARPEPPAGTGYLRDEDLVGYLRQWVDPATVVAVDAPLTLPPCANCGEPCPGTLGCEVPQVVHMRGLLGDGAIRGSKPRLTPYTQRLTELVLAAEGLPVREALGQSTGPLTARAARLRRMLAPDLRLNENLIEVSPRAALVRLFGADAERAARLGARSDVRDARARMLEELRHRVQFRHVWPEVVVRSRPVFLAVVTAFVAHLWAKEAWTRLAQLGDGRLREAARRWGPGWISEGWIWVPPAAEGEA